MSKFMKNKKGASLIIVGFSILSLLSICAFALDMGIILNQRYELQKAVESTALISAAEYEPYETGGGFAIPGSVNITNINANSQFQTIKTTNQLLMGLSTAPNIEFDSYSKALRIRMNTNVSTYFLQFLGINNIRITANAAAVNMPVFLSNKLPKPYGSILRGTGSTYSDTMINQPLGSVASNTRTIDNQNVNYANIFGIPDGKSLSLGPGGYITIKLPATLVDGKGVDFAIFERGHAEGYYVYAGIDKDTTQPYADAANPGADINWINISCTGIPLNVDKNSTIGAHVAPVFINGVSGPDYKFYGSGYFDLGATCTDSGGTVIYDGSGANPSAPRISNVKYLKIIDDNTEDGFFIQSTNGITAPSAIPMLIPGEHSTITPGADLDSIAIYHHSRLIRTTQYGQNSDSDHLINVLETMYGLNPTNADSDGDGVDDLQELWGYDPADLMRTDTLVTDTLLNGAPPILYFEYPTWAQSPPMMEIAP